MGFDLYTGDCLEIMKNLPDQSIHAIVTDPPYGLSNHKHDEVIACLKAWLAGEVYQPKGKGFMGKAWDAWVPGPEVWRECLRVLKPGGHMLVFAGTRSMDLMCMAIRIAGFELRDSIGYAHDGGGAPLAAWVQGSGFPKNMDIAKQIDREAKIERTVTGYRTDGRYAYGFSEKSAWHGRETFGQGTKGEITEPATEAARQYSGFGTALKPSWEPILICRKPIAESTIAGNVLAWGTGGLNINACRIGTEERSYKSTAVVGAGRERAVNLVDRGDGKTPDGRNLALALERQKRYRDEAYNSTVTGRWPANFCHDGSDEVLELFPETSASKSANRGAGINGNTFVSPKYASTVRGHDDNGGSAARFFYCAKASGDDRNEGCEYLEDTSAADMVDRAPGSDGMNSPRAGAGRTSGGKNNHPTVKPVDLCRWLCLLATPPGGIVLDPFMGSGSVGKGAIMCDFRFIGIDIDPKYVEIARARIEAKDLPLLKEIRTAAMQPEQQSLFEEAA